MQSSPLIKPSLSSALLAGMAAVVLYLAGEITGGMLASHMLVHIALMSLVAPAVAIQLRQFLAHRRVTVPFAPLWLVTSAQIALFAGWHSPPGLAIGMSSPVSSAIMQLSLLAIATLFWLTLLLRVSSNRWVAIFALLLTGKIFCLVGALMVFAPRLLFGHDVAPYAPVTEVMLAHAMSDQQLAGLLMLTACPLTYLLASVVIVSDWLFRIGIPRSSQALSPSANS